MHVLAEMTLGQWALAFLVVCVCLFLILVILLQRGRGGGIAGAFGGGGGSSAFGAKTGDVFTWITVAFAGIFLVLAVAGNFVFRPSGLPDPSAASAGVVPGSPADGQPQTITLTPEGATGADGIKVEMIPAPPGTQTQQPASEGGQPTQPATPPAQDGVQPQQPAAEPAPHDAAPPPAEPAGNDNNGNAEPGNEKADDAGPGRG